jgi:Phage ABA sandwich domain
MTGDDDNEAIRVEVAQFLGWSHFECNRYGFLVGYVPGKKAIRPVPSYVIDIKAAWEIVEHLASRGIRFTLENQALAGHVRNYFVEIGNEKTSSAKAHHFQAPMAICIAFREFSKPPVVKRRDIT